MNYRKAMVTRDFGVPWLLLCISIFLVLPTISSDDPVPATKDGQSICKQYHRVTVMKEVSYIETYQETWGRWLQKTRLNQRSEKFTQWRSIEMCCPGYEPHQLEDDAEKCVPVCPSECLNGTCHRPNECICDAGYLVSINNGTGFSECQPNCTSGCHGGSCIEPETCSCDVGYVPAEDQRSCQASCINVGGSGPQNCGENAICIEPDTCSCADGYGAFTVEKSFWRPSITERSQLKTFKFNNVTCKPLCNPECNENSDCIAPNKCQCTTGYTAAFPLDEPIRCLPVCEQNCVNGVCIRPNVCTCNEGYKAHDWLGKAFCEPICQNDCINGKCTLPNHCECAIGYEKLVIGSGTKQIVSNNVCVPVCPGNCTNGRCVAPGQCHCNQGYDFKLRDNLTLADLTFNNQSIRSCQPNCEPDCPYGHFCIAPNQCQIQYYSYKILEKFPKFRTRIVNNTDDCGNGQLLMKNNRTVCSFKSNDTNCYEDKLCAFIIVDHQQETITNFRNLRSIISAINETKEFIHNVTNHENNQTFKWQAPRCTEECRILIPSGDFSKIVTEDEIDDCFELKSHNETTGVFLRPIANSTSIHHRGIRRLGGVWIKYPAICFLRNHITSDTTSFMMTEDVVKSNGHGVIIGIIGALITIILIVALAVLLYRGRAQLRRLRNFRGVSASSDTVMDGSMAQFNTGEN